VLLAGQVEQLPDQVEVGAHASSMLSSTPDGGELFNTDRPYDQRHRVVGPGEGHRLDVEGLAPPWGQFDVGGDDLLLRRDQARLDQVAVQDEEAAAVARACFEQDLHLGRRRSGVLQSAPNVVGDAEVSVELSLVERVDEGAVPDAREAEAAA